MDVCQTLVVNGVVLWIRAGAPSCLGLEPRNSMLIALEKVGV